MAQPLVAILSVAKTEKICKRSQCRGAAAKSPWKTRARQAPKSAAEADADTWHVYSCHIPVISTWSVKDDLSALVSAHMLRMCLWHAWSDVCWLFHCFFDCLKALNENCTYGRHIPLQINHMSDIICYNDFSTVTAELIIFLLFKLQCPRLAANGPAGQAFESMDLNIPTWTYSINISLLSMFNRIFHFCLIFFLDDIQTVLWLHKLIKVTDQ